MPFTRRDLLPLSAAVFASGLQHAGAAEGKPDAVARAPYHEHAAMPAHWYGKEKIAFLAYPDFTALDLVGPHYMLSSLMGATTYIVAKTKQPVISDAKLAFVPHVTFEDCPVDLDVICVPGGTTGTLAAMEDEATLRFLADRGARAKFVTSVCTGSLVLGASGLLNGYKATSHWVARDVLKEFGAEPVDQRVVVDRNRITGAGVTAGIDFGLTLLAMMRDQLYAESMQLLAEYAPAPPFAAGTPATAPKASIDMMSGMFVPFIDDLKAAARRSAARRG